MDTSDVLLAVRDALREHGWARRDVRRDDGGGCLLGGFRRAQEQGYEVADAVRHLGLFCHNRYGVITIAGVNDRVLTSEDEACDLLEAAAKWDGGA